MKLVAICALAFASPAVADPLRLSANVFAGTTSPAGLLTISADAAPGPGTSVEALVWTGGGGNLTGESPGDVLVMVVRGRTETGRTSGQVGRFVAMLGALRPVHVDGAAARVRLPHRFDVETYGGIPVLPGLATSRSWDWVVGGRVSRRLGDWGSVGVAYLQQRDDGRLDTEEVGVDTGFALGKRDDLGAKVAYDLANPGLAEARLSASHKRGALRTEVFASYLAASHRLPATSLFSVLGDIPAQTVGTTVTWRAAPRLDLLGDLAVRHAEDRFAPETFVRAKLRLDERGINALGCELRRDGVGDDGWTGVRGMARIGLPHGLAVSSELEVVVPDHDRGLGRIWPWALAALGWHRGPWQAALAVEASASPSDVRRIDILGQLGRTWGLQ